MSLIISLTVKKTNKYWNKLVDEKILYLNSNLIKYGISAYQYPDRFLFNETQTPSMRYRSYDLDYLKFIAAKLEENSSWIPHRNFVRHKISPDLKKKYIDENRSHLICHHNSFGDYVPVSFKNTCLPTDFISTIGSSFNLCNELEELAEKLKLNLVTYTPDRQTLFEQIYQNVREGDRLEFEKTLLLELYNMALGSIKHNLVINFSG